MGKFLISSEMECYRTRLYLNGFEKFIRIMLLILITLGLFLLTATNSCQLLDLTIIHPIHDTTLPAFRVFIMFTHKLKNYTVWAKPTLLSFLTVKTEALEQPCSSVLRKHGRNDCQAHSCLRTSGRRFCWVLLFQQLVYDALRLKHNLIQSQKSQQNSKSSRFSETMKYFTATLNSYLCNKVDSLGAGRSLTWSIHAYGMGKSESLRYVMVQLKPSRSRSLYSDRWTGASTASMTNLCLGVRTRGQSLGSPRMCTMTASGSAFNERSLVAKQAEEAPEGHFSANASCP